MICDNKLKANICIRLTYICVYTILNLLYKMLNARLINEVMTLGHVKISNYKMLQLEIVSGLTIKHLTLYRQIIIFLDAFFVYWYITLCWLFNVKAIVVEEQWYYLTHGSWPKRIHTFPKGISRKLNVIVWLEFELTHLAASDITPWKLLRFYWKWICKPDETLYTTVNLLRNDKWPSMSGKCYIFITVSFLNHVSANFLFNEHIIIFLFRLCLRWYSPSSGKATKSLSQSVSYW